MADPAGGDGLAALLGPTRAAVLRALAAPRGTVELAGVVGISPASASEHAKVLREVVPDRDPRDGRAVRHSLTALGRTMLGQLPAASDWSDSDVRQCLILSGRILGTMVQRTGNGVPAHDHVVLASADSEAFTSLRKRSTSRDDRYRMGKEIRQQVPRSSLGDWTVRADRPDPVQLISESHRGRLEWLIPVRVGRMTATPYGFLRGAAIVMADDVARLPSTGITPVICGDAHLGNFGFYGSPNGIWSST